MSVVENTDSVENGFIELHTLVHQTSLPDTTQSRPCSEVHGHSTNDSTDEPQVLLHRKGPYIEAIEFCCSCGKRTVVRLLYNGD
ncbi:MAG: hypothetical protein N3A63_05440 [Bacteroidetes bacterium]|nr:hypothetical protein [Bacteroidota bacterium]